jgi:hypothetical protein
MSGGGSANCSNVAAATEDQCKSTNVAVPINAAFVNGGDQSNNTNQNSHVGCANSIVLTPRRCIRG